MKKQWSIPTMSQLNVAATQNGPEPSTAHDLTTYDTNGNWWAGGVSKNN